MTLRSKLSALVMIAAFAAPSMALAQSTVTLSKGDTMNVQMQDALSTGNAYIGERFTARVIPPYPEGDSDLANAVITGEVTKVTQAGQGRNPEMYLSFNTITLQNGSSYPLNAQLTSTAGKPEQKNAGHVALTTIGGMIAGNIIGKTIFHSGIGGLLGAAGGFLIGNNKKSNLSVPAGAQLQLTLTRPLLVRRQARRIP